MATPKTKISMYFPYGGRSRAGIQSLNTFDAIKAGERTATTRFPVWYKNVPQQLEVIRSLAPGDLIEIFNTRKYNDPRRESILVEAQPSERSRAHGLGGATYPVSLDLLQKNPQALQRWSELEGWSPEAALEFFQRDGPLGYQFQFRPVEEGSPIVVPAAPNMSTPMPQPFTGRTPQGLNTSPTVNLNQAPIVQRKPSTGKKLSRRQDFMRAGDIHLMAIEEDLKANPIMPKSFNELQRVIDSRYYNGLGGAFAILPQKVSRHVDQIAADLVPFLNDRGLDLGKYGVGMDGQPYVSWSGRQHFGGGGGGGGGGSEPSEISIFPQAQRQTKSWLNNTISPRYLQDESLAPLVQMGPFRRDDSPVLKINGVRAERPGPYPLRSGDEALDPDPINRAIESLGFPTDPPWQWSPGRTGLSALGLPEVSDTVIPASAPFGQVFRDIDQELIDPRIGYRNNPESLMMTVKRNNARRNPQTLIPSAQNLAAPLPEILAEGTRTWIDSPHDPYQGVFFQGGLDDRRFAIGDLEDPDWQRPYSEIEAGSNQALSMAPSLRRALPPSREVEVVSTDIPYRNQRPGSPPWTGGSAIPPAFQQPDPLPVAGGYDISTLPEVRHFLPSEWGESNPTIMLPSTVLADKKLSPYQLTVSSETNAKAAGFSNLTNEPYVETDPNLDYVYTRLKTGETSEPMRDAGYVRDRLHAAAKRANAGYASERNRSSSMVPFVSGLDLLGMPVDRQRELKVGSAAIVDRMLQNTKGMSPQLLARLQSARENLGISAPLDIIAERQRNRDEYARRANFADQAIDDAYRRLPTTIQDPGNPEYFVLPDEENTRFTEVSRAPGPPGVHTWTEAMTLRGRLDMMREARAQGLTQPAILLPTGGQVGPENIAAHYVYPSSQKKIQTQGGRRYLYRNGENQEVFPLGAAQQAQLQAEVAQGLRQQQYFPIGTTNPYASMPEEIVVDGVGQGYSRDLPVQFGNAGINERMMALYPRFDTAHELQRQTAGQRLRGESSPAEVVPELTDVDRAIARYPLSLRRRTHDPISYTQTPIHW